MIDILIPTYNRSNDLVKNIKHIDRLILNEGFNDKFRVFVSNNASSDDTSLLLEGVKSVITIELIIYEQKTNIGLEKNALFLLEKSTSEFLMYIGDDDYLPDGYLTYVVSKIKSDANATLIIPGITANYGNGYRVTAREENFLEVRYMKGYRAIYKTSYLGHQLSGVAQKRSLLLKKYNKNKALQNIYLFIYFSAFNASRGNVYYAPRYKMLVTEYNSREWTYDDSGLLMEIFKNYKILFPHSLMRRFWLYYYIMYKQPFRIMHDKSVKNTIKSFRHLIEQNDLEASFKYLLPFIYPYVALIGVIRIVKRRFN